MSQIEDFLTLYAVDDNQLRYCCKLLSYAKVEKGQYVMVNGEVNIVDDSRDVFFVLIRGRISLRKLELSKERNFDEYVRSSVIKRKSTKRSRFDLKSLSTSAILSSKYTRTA